MKAALIERLGEQPRLVTDRAQPRAQHGRALVKVTAAPLNPVDISLAAGRTVASPRFFPDPPKPPYIPGREGVGEVMDSSAFETGKRVYFETSNGEGALAECALVDERMMVEFEGSASDETASCLGIPGLAAWLALEWRGALKPGETVLVLAAGGLVGSIAVQAAKIMGAARVIAANRSKGGLERALTLGADEGVELNEAEDLAKRFSEAARGGVDLVIDPLWGAPAEAAIEVLNPNGRLVQIGQSAGAEARVKSASLRGKMASLLGYTNFGVPWSAKAEAYRKMIRLSSEGRLKVEFEAMKLGDIVEAWKRQAAGPGAKLVIRP